MKQYTIFGTIVDTETSVETKQYGAAKPQKPKKHVVHHPYRCKTNAGERIVWAQHEYQAVAKCIKMHGSCNGRPELQ